MGVIMASFQVVAKVAVDSEVLTSLVKTGVKMVEYSFTRLVGSGSELQVAGFDLESRRSMVELDRGSRLLRVE
jgi:hypothetical protein